MNSQQQQQQQQKNTIKKKQQQQNLVRQRKPHFFKVLLGDFTHHLRIPPKFLKHIPGPATESKTAIFLHGPSGSKWTVELRRNREGTFLASGWSKFVKDHSLKECEFLVFRYDGNMHFTVFLFDTTACEREDAFAVRRLKQPWKTRGRRLKEEPVEVSSCSVKQEIMKHGVEETKPVQIQPYLPSQERCVAFPDPIWNDKLKMEEFELPLSMIRNKRNYRRLCISSTRRHVTDEEKLQAHKVAKSFTSALPYTIIRMSTTTLFKGYMNIPTRFSREHLPQNTSNLILHDPIDRSWVVNYIPKEKGNKISRGWMAFAKANKLEEGDFCVFELVGTVKLRVHIFRVIEETLPISTVPTRSE
ncbi:B3 domain-containing protein Os01g0723500-like isoform X1 [Zingiber officinale]|uniref:B3 domain-containing protein Os01g0723500-like isoform X1 n=1 Tax=Zingiber officinale TaxID=94328 RepID=UPI001C4B2C53|nr:B3 domain-containing protein Os01g0723500-like isoform X1 [Zingiber officinale]